MLVDRVRCHDVETVEKGDDGGLGELACDNRRQSGNAAACQDKRGSFQDRQP